MFEYILAIAEAIGAGAIIVIGGMVEGTGKGLSLGTKWPYTKNMPRLAKSLDSEVWHRFVATFLGLNALAILILGRGQLEIVGFLLVAGTALLGLGTLYTQAGKAPSFIQGTHDILAYLTLLDYLLLAISDPTNFGTFLLHKIPLHSFLLVAFMGGLTAGQRGFGKAIGQFVMPKTFAQWAWVIHMISVLIFVLTLAYYFPLYNVAFLLTLVQMGVGLFSYQSVNRNPRRPGMLIPTHQLFSVLVVVSIFFGLSIHIPFL